LKEVTVISLPLSKLRQLAPNGRDDYLAHLAGDGATELQKAGLLDSPLRLCHFLAQIAHETGGFTIRVESLNYKTAKRLMHVWPKRFPTEASARPFLGKPTQLGDKVYGGRMGNKDPGDGFKYRGRGYLQTTGRSAYKTFGTLISEDLEAEPDKVADPAISLRCAVAEWAGSKINAAADDDDIRKVTKLVNGGLNGLAERKQWLSKAKAIFGA
jgi:putative chitinase